MIATKRTFASDAAMTTAGAVLSRALALLAVFSTIRIFTAETYGTWLLILTFVGFFLPFSTLRLEIPFVMSHESSQVGGLLTVMLACCVTSTIAISIVIIGLPSNWLELVSGLSTNKYNLLFLAIPAFALQGTQVILQGVLLRQQQFFLIVLASLIVPTVAILLTLIAPFLTGPTAVTAGFIYIASTMSGLLIGSKLLLREMANPWVGVRSVAIAALRRNSVYPKYTLPWSLSVTVTERLTQLTIAQFYSLEALASFYVARQLMSGVTSIVGGALRNVFFAHGVRDANSVAIRARASSMLKLLTFLIVPALSLGCFWTVDIVTFFVGNNWPNLPTMAWYCLFPATVMLFTGPLDRVFDLAGQQKLSVALQVLSDAAMLLVIGIAAMNGAGVEQLVLCIVTVLTVYNLIWLVFALSALRTSLKDMLLLFSRFAILFAVACFVCWLLRHQLPLAASLVLSVLFVVAASAPGLFVVLAQFPSVACKIPSRLRLSLTDLP